MTTSKTFDVEAFLNSRKIGGTHILVVALLILTMMIDGYDLFMVGIILPKLAEGLGVEPQDLTVVFIVQQFGLLIGTFFVGPFADRFGRKITLLASLFGFGVLTLLTTFATSVTDLVAMRFIAGLFFSGVIPNTVSLVSEIMPVKWRAGAVSLVFSGFTGGFFIGSAVLVWLIDFGWQSAFVIGGALPLLMCIALFFLLPESIRFLVNKQPDDPRIGKTLRRLDKSIELTGDEHFILTEEKAEGSATAAAPVAALFRDGRWLTTMLLWVGFHGAFIVSNLFGSWNTTVLHDSGGLSYTRIALLISCKAMAGIIGTITSGFIMDRFGPTRVLAAFFVLAALSIVSIAFVDLTTSWAIVCFVLFGFFTNGGLSGINALGSITYPSWMRATGLSWAHGAGRAGAMIGPAIGGLMIAQNFGVTGIFLFAAIPQFLAGVAIVLIRKARPKDVPHQRSSADDFAEGGATAMSADLRQ